MYASFKQKPVITAVDVSALIVKCSTVLLNLDLAHVSRFLWFPESTSTKCSLSYFDDTFRFVL